MLRDTICRVSHYAMLYSAKLQINLIPCDAILRNFTLYFFLSISAASADLKTGQAENRGGNPPPPDPKKRGSSITIHKIMRVQHRHYHGDPLCRNVPSKYTSLQTCCSQAKLGSWERAEQPKNLCCGRRPTQPTSNVATAELEPPSCAPQKPTHPSNLSA